MNSKCTGVLFTPQKPGFHMIVPVVSKKCSDDQDDHMETLPRRSQTIRTTETTSITWIELYPNPNPNPNPIPCDRPDHLNIFWDDWDDSDDHMETRLKNTTLGLAWALFHPEKIPLKILRCIWSDQILDLHPLITKLYWIRCLLIHRKPK